MQADADAAAVPGRGADRIVHRVVGDDGAWLPVGFSAQEVGVPGRPCEIGVEGAESVAVVRDGQVFERQQHRALLTDHARKPAQGRFGDARAAAETGRGEELRRENLLSVHVIDAPERNPFQQFVLRRTLGRDQAAFLGDVHRLAVNRDDDPAGAVGYAVQFRLALLADDFAKAVLVKFLDIVIFGRQDHLAVRVNQPFLAIEGDLGETVVETGSAVETRFDDPGLVLGLVAVLFRLLVPDRFEILGRGLKAAAEGQQ